ncbi:MAG: CHAT domain-containing protein [Magnetococcales bacterium]|nr:CHAT domain-containing protein [Magnetococcales bacterium]
MRGRLAILLGLLWLTGGCGSDPAWEIRSLLARQRYAEAVELFQQSSELNLDRSPLDVVLDYCQSLFETKNYEPFFRCSGRYLERVEAPGEEDEVYFADQARPPAGEQAAPVRTWLALASLELGDYPEARDQARRVITALERDREREENSPMWRRHMVEAHRAAGLALALAGDQAGARDLMERLDGLVPMKDGSSLDMAIHHASIQVGMALGDFARVRREIDRYDGIHPIELILMAATWVNPLQGALNTIGRVGRSAIPDENAWMVTLPRRFMHARACLGNGDPACATQGYDALLRDPNLGNLADLHWMTLFDRGRLALEEGEPAQALGFWRRAVAVMESPPAFADPSVSRTGVAGDRDQVYQALMETLFLQQRSQEAFELSERAKALWLVRHLARPPAFKGGAGGGRGAAPGFAALLNRWETLQRANTHLSPDRAAWEEANLEEAMLQVGRRLEEEYPETASLMAVIPIATVNIQGMLEPDETLVAFHQGERGLLYAFLLSRQGFQAQRLEIPDLDRLVEELRLALAVTGGPGLSRVTAALHRQLWLPLSEGGIHTRNLVIVPHGSLNGLPFALLGPEGEPPLGVVHGIRMLPAAANLAYLSKRKRGLGGRMLSLGNPWVPGDAVPASPTAREEALAVAIAVATADARLAAQVRLEQQATEGAFRKLAAQSRYLHLVVPGRMGEVDPLRAALLLTPDETNDGVLTVREMFDLTLDAELITLTALETPWEPGQGEGPPAMVRALLYAGCNSVLIGLWQTRPLDTLRFVRRFFHYYKLIGEKRAALRQTREELWRREGSQPAEWAGMQLHGVP